jgi:hypothetical protein
VEKCGLDVCGSGQGSVTGSFGHGNEPSVSIKGGEFLDYLSDYWLRKQGSARWNSEVS